MTDISFYLDYIKSEIEQLAPDFTGNIEFKLNFKQGGIANLNCTLGKSVKCIESIKEKTYS